MPELSEVKLPKTVNEALKILAYNDYFWNDQVKRNKIHPHCKDLDTVKSLAESQYIWTEKQAKLAIVILKRYLTKFKKHELDIKPLLDNPKYDEPFRVIDFKKSIEKFIDEDEELKIEIKFPYQKKIIQLIRCLKDKKDMPKGYAHYNGENKKWLFKQTDITTYYLTLIAIRYDFKFVDKTLLDDYYEVREEIKRFKQPIAKLIGGEIVLSNIAESLQEYWSNNIKNKTLLQQVDQLKNFCISTQGINVDAKNLLSQKIAHNNYHALWIDSKEFSKNNVIQALTELDCFPLIMPYSGELSAKDDATEWKDWLDVFEKNGINTLKEISFGFDIKEPARPQDGPTDDLFGGGEKIDEETYQLMYDVHQLSKQFKYIDKNTKIIFVRNRIPRTLIKSKIKPKASLIGLGGGHYAAGTENLKRLLENLPKKLYYNNHQPSSWDWHDRIIVKL